MLKFRQTVRSLRSSNMLLSRAGLAPQTGLESFPRFQVLRQGFQGRHCHSLNCSLRSPDLIHKESLWNSLNFRLDIKRRVATTAGLSEDGGSDVPLCLITAPWLQQMRNGSQLSLPDSRKIYISECFSKAKELIRLETKFLFGNGVCRQQWGQGWRKYTP